MCVQVWLRCQVERKDEAKKTEMRGRIRWRKEEGKGRKWKGQARRRLLEAALRYSGVVDVELIVAVD